MILSILLKRCTTAWILAWYCNFVSHGMNNISLTVNNAVLFCSTRTAMHDRWMYGLPTKSLQNVGNQMYGRLITTIVATAPGCLVSLQSTCINSFARQSACEPHPVTGRTRFNSKPFIGKVLLRIK